MANVNIEPTPVEICKALEKIVATCNSNTSCTRCPLGNTTGRCLLCSTTPNNWLVGEPPKNEIWRAFIYGNP